MNTSQAPPRAIPGIKPHQLSVFVQLAALHGLLPTPDDVIHAEFTTFPVARLQQRLDKPAASQPPPAALLDFAVIVPDPDMFRSFYPHELTVPAEVVRAMEAYESQHGRVLLIAAPDQDDAFRMLSARAVKQGRSAQSAYEVAFADAPTLDELVAAAGLSRLLTGASAASRIERPKQRKTTRK